jgi:hypothetical protein
MNTARKAEIEMVVLSVKYVMQETDLIRDTKSWNEEDFLYAMGRIQTDLVGLSREEQNQIRGLYRTRLKERQDENARVAFENVSAQRHEEISRRLNELKKPPKSIFWMTAVILILTAIGVVLAFLALRH